MEATEAVKTARVFVTQDVVVRGNDNELKQKFDFTPAAEFGKVEVLVGASQSVANIVPVVRQLKERLKDFGEEDSLLTIGNPSVMTAAAVIAAQRNNGRYKLLQWDRRTGAYIRIQVDTSGRAV